MYHFFYLIRYQCRGLELGLELGFMIRARVRDKRLPAMFCYFELASGLNKSARLTYVVVREGSGDLKGQGL